MKPNRILLRSRTYTTVLAAGSGLLAAVAAGVLIPPASAELPPSAYEQMRKEAPIVAEILVKRLEVKSTPGAGGERDPVRTNRITAVAEVARVLRRPTMGKQTASVGEGKPATIRIRYENSGYGAGWAGPRLIPVLVEGTRYRAYLNCEPDGTYSPAARGASFDLQSVTRPK